MRALTLAVLACAVLTGCAPDLSDDGKDYDSGEVETSGEGWVDGRVSVTPEGDGVFLSVVDATREEEEVRYALSDPGEADDDWDLSFRRYWVRLNGGGEVAVAVVEGEDFDALQQAPADGYSVDVADAESDDGMSGPFDDWYDYDATEHTLSPADRVYVIRDSSGAYHKLQFVSYYSDIGDSGVLSVRHASVGAP